MGLGACTASGTVACASDGASSACNAVAGTPGVEICGNAIDDDCNGTVDDCRPVNDDIAHARALVMTASETVSIGDTVGATVDGTIPAGCGCTTTTGNVWHSFTLSQPELVYVDTNGSAIDTAIWIATSDGTPVPAQAANGRPLAGVCNDDGGCGTNAPRTWSY